MNTKNNNEIGSQGIDVLTELKRLTSKMPHKNGDIDLSEGRISIKEGLSLLRSEVNYLDLNLDCYNNKLYDFIDNRLCTAGDDVDSEPTVVGETALSIIENIHYLINKLRNHNERFIKLNKELSDVIG